MRIGIDIDGVLTDTGKFSIEKGLEYAKITKQGSLINPLAYDTTDIFGWDLKTDLDFWKKYIFDLAKNNPPLPKTNTNIKRLKEKGHEIYIITARWLTNPLSKNCSDYEKELQDKMRQTVIDWLKENNIYYDKILFTQENKVKEIIDNKIDIMIEDSPKNILTLSKYTKIICMDQVYNKEVSGYNIYRCYNWDDISRKIKELENDE